MADYRHHKYEWTKPYGTARHQWSLVGPKGGIHFHISFYEGDENRPSAGLEVHWFSPPLYMRDRAPSHLDCHLLKAPCWHDGTSLYAVEHVWPAIRGYWRTGEHEKIFEVLEREADMRFVEPSHD